MKKLTEIIPKVVAAEHNLPDILISDIGIDSREIKENNLFFAVSGGKFDGHDYIETAINNGAVVIVHEKDLNKIEGIFYLKVKSVRNLIGEVASLFFDEPSKNIRVVGVTGTNGKTSVATILFQIATSAGFKCGLLSTVENNINGTVFSSTHTTGDAIQIQRNLKNMVDAECEYCFMEVSSHSLAQGRVLGLCFTGAVFTNFTQDHLDYHKDMESYFEAKKLLFDNLPKESFAVTNKDDSFGLRIVEDTKAKVLTYGQSNPDSDYLFEMRETSIEGLEISINNLDLEIPLVGEFNAYNFVAVYASLRELGLSHEQISKESSIIKGAVGRMDRIVSPTGVVGIIDYAHTPDALENVLVTLESFKRKGKIISIAGAGGDRDKTKRSLMAEVLDKYSDILVLTSDNPRNEDPEEIINDMLKGVSKKEKAIVILDRREAIKRSVALAEPGDIVLIAGKGHEDYQIIGDVKKHFSDKQELEKAFNL
ncbi:MAG: UDP-N-acetylmuramoyl-L-alanyl-D-glutamate--2,6-diaminopimelate ligase [Candidatus Paceibacteria bacterium]|jgi:UDP-N-acetylmuramoyl-L-alanyl-D-glutamate--2,6-diaminopimelate ligase